MHTERTPNPDSVKWVLERELLEGGRPVALESSAPPGVSALGSCLLEIPGVVALLLTDHSITVNKSPGADWRTLGQEVSRAIRDWNASGEPLLGPDYKAPELSDEDDLVVRIRSVLETEISAFVAQDGGEIQFESFERGVVRVRLRGACEGCPSSLMTLKMGIEVRLREEIPEVHSVEAV